MDKKIIDDGGQAFPDGYHRDSYGMTLRDWFAGMAMQGIVSNSVIAGLMHEMKTQAMKVDIPPKEFEKTVEFPAYASAAFSVADAMIEARKQ